MAQGPLRSVVAGLPKAVDGVDDECRQECIYQGDGSHDEADENRHRRDRSSGSWLEEADGLTSALQPSPWTAFRSGCVPNAATSMLPEMIRSLRESWSRFTFV